MGLWTLLKALVLLANALAILNEDRFLAPRGWGFNDSAATGAAFKRRLIDLVHGTQFFRVPLIFINTVIAIIMVFSG